MNKLSMLILPGSDIDDGVTSNWSSLKSLWEINLDDTEVSVATIAWLGSIDSLRRVSLNRVPLDPVAADALSQLNQVSELQLAEVELGCEKLIPLLDAGNMESLNLSGWDLNEELLELINASPSLKLLKIHDTTVTEEQVKQLMEVNSAIYVDAGELSKQFAPALTKELRRRAIALAQGSSSGWRQTLRERVGTYQRRNKQGWQGDAEIWLQGSTRVQLDRFRTPPASNFEARNVTERP